MIAQELCVFRGKRKESEVWFYPIMGTDAMNMYIIFGKSRLCITCPKFYLLGVFTAKLPLVYTFYVSFTGNTSCLPDFFFLLSINFHHYGLMNINLNPCSSPVTLNHLNHLLTEGGSFTWFLCPSDEFASIDSLEFWFYF